MTPTEGLAVLIGAVIVAAARWVLDHWHRRPARVTQAEAWALGFRAGVRATVTGHPEPNPYDPATLDVRQES